MSRQKQSSFLMTFLALALFHAFPAIATPPPPVLKPGITEEEVLTLLGQPDRRNSSGKGIEVWNYGESVLVIEEGRTQMISDRGNLVSRLKMSQKTQAPIPPPAPESLWVNPWTPPGELSGSDLYGILFR